METEPPGPAFLWRAAGIDGKTPPTPRSACFTFGLRNLRPSRTRPGDPQLAALIERATGQDCLDAAFALQARTPSALVAAAHCRTAVPPPFRDADYFAAIARWLGCRFADGALAARLLRAPRVEVSATVEGTMVRTAVDGRVVLVTAPAAAWLPGLAALVSRCPAAARRIVIVTPAAMAAADTGEGPLTNRGRLRPLHAIPRPALADRVVTRPQAISFVLALAALAAGAGLAPTAAFAGLVVAVTVVLLGYAASRGLAAVSREPPRLPRRPLRAADLPEYSILVPLYREDDSLAHLVRALRRLDYPADKLDIQFLVEADDAETQRALARHARSLRCRMTVVPPGEPRTKPRALNVGLRQARGRLVTIFDAEDRPHPGQLRLAAETFAAAPPDLAALQARLTIDHVADSWLTKMFAIEYACQFDHILPMVAARGRLLLLGGTSNHFRVEALVRAGGWDPFNVTEDADLAVRLRRFGYRLATLDSETHEEAPLTVRAWIKQRARWFKGFMQTWLVHNRRPLALVREIGWADAALVHLFIVGALVAALAHIVFLGQLVAALTGAAPVLVGGPAAVSLLQAGAILAGYGASFALGAVSIRRRANRRLGLASVLWFPVYWILMGCAVLVAVHDLVRMPHHWRKTRHGVAERPSRVATRSRPFRHRAAVIRPVRAPGRGAPHAGPAPAE